MSALDAVTTRLDALKVVTLTDGEVWSARDLMEFAGYSRWEKWSHAIRRAITSVEASGLDAADHFRGSVKMVTLGSGARRQIEDYDITRYGCYVLFQNADGSKPEIAALQQYFAVQTRKQEVSASKFDPTTLEGAKAIIAAASAAIAALEVAQPKADAWDELASADGDYEVADAAKILARSGVEVGRKRLFDRLEDIGWIFRGPQGKWRAYQDSVDVGYLRERPQSHHHPRTGEVILDPPQVRVTVRGIDRLRVRLGTKEIAA